jgi:hypothetical protein
VKHAAPTGALAAGSSRSVTWRRPLGARPGIPKRPSRGSGAPGKGDNASCSWSAARRSRVWRARKNSERGREAPSRGLTLADGWLRLTVRPVAQQMASARPRRPGLAAKGSSSIANTTTAGVVGTCGCQLSQAERGTCASGRLTTLPGVPEPSGLSMPSPSCPRPVMAGGSRGSCGGGWLVVGSPTMRSYRLTPCELLKGDSCRARDRSSTRSRSGPARQGGGPGGARAPGGGPARRVGQQPHHHAGRTLDRFLPAHRHTLQAHEDVIVALTAHIQQLPEQLRLSLTWDRGLEMAEPKRFTVDTGLQVYLCDPRARCNAARTRTSTGCYASICPREQPAALHPGRPQPRRRRAQRPTLGELLATAPLMRVCAPNSAGARGCQLSCGRSRRRPHRTGCSANGRRECCR